MAKSSINFAKAKSGGLNHNDRTEKKEPHYLLPKEHRLGNEIDVSAERAKEHLTELYNASAERYYYTHHQKIQATSYVWEAVINLNKEHQLFDVQKLVKELEKETGFTSVQIAIHKDEGHINERGIVEYNLHAHVTFFTLDEFGEQLYRKTVKSSIRDGIEKDILDQGIKKGNPKTDERKAFNKLVFKEIKANNYKIMDTARLSKIQTLTAKSLGMERGTVSNKEEAEKLGVEVSTPATRLEHKQHRASQKSKRVVKSELNTALIEVTTRTKQNEGIREDYAVIEQEKRDLLKLVKAKTLTNDVLEERILDLESKLELMKKERENAPKAVLDNKAAPSTQEDGKMYLKAISAHLDTQDDIGYYEKNQNIEALDALADKSTRNDFVDIFNEKGENIRGGRIAFEREDLINYIDKLDANDKATERVVTNTKVLLNKFEKVINPIKDFIKEHFIIPLRKKNKARLERDTPKKEQDNVRRR